jgi:hypothetical protein
MGKRYSLVLFMLLCQNSGIGTGVYLLSGAYTYPLELRDT